MTDLLRRPVAATGTLHDITPKSAGWDHAGLAVHRLRQGEGLSRATKDREAILVLIEGRAEMSAGEERFGEMGDRTSPFKGLPHALYVPAESDWSARATSDCVIAVCSAPARPGHAARCLGPKGLHPVSRGEGILARRVTEIAMEAQEGADTLLVREVVTPGGAWASWPGHRHDEDDFPRITRLEEISYHRVAPEGGFAVQRIFDGDGLDVTLTIRDGDVTLVPRGHHPRGVPPGVELYSLIVMAGPLRALRVETDPAFTAFED